MELLVPAGQASPPAAGGPPKMPAPLPLDGPDRELANAAMQAVRNSDQNQDFDKMQGTRHPCAQQLPVCPWQSQNRICPLENLDGALCAACLIGVDHSVCTGNNVALHPCIRVWGACKYGNQCAFSQMPQVWCLYCLRRSRHLHCDGVKPMKIPAHSVEFQASVRAHEKERNTQRKLKKMLEQQREERGEADKPLPVTWLPLEEQRVADISLLPMLMYVSNQHGNHSRADLPAFIDSVVVPLLQEVSNRTGIPLPLLKIGLTPEHQAQLDEVSGKWALCIVQTSMWLAEIREHFGSTPSFLSDGGEGTLALLARTMWSAIAEHLLPASKGSTFKDTILNACAHGIATAQPDWIDAEGLTGCTHFMAEYIVLVSDCITDEQFSAAGEAVVTMCKQAENTYLLKLFLDVVRPAVETEAAWQPMYMRWEEIANEAPLSREPSLEIDQSVSMSMAE